MKFHNIALEALQPSAVNPRGEELRNMGELRDSVAAVGILEPLIVRAAEVGYVILAGHRRAEAARMAGLETVPCVIRDAVEHPEHGALLIHLIENVQRDALSPAETARAVTEALKPVHLGGKKMKQKTLAEHLGKSEVWVSKFAIIGKALVKLGDEGGKLAAITDQDKAYKEARKVLGMDAGEVQLNLVEEEEAALEPVPELEVIAELRKLALDYVKTHCPRLSEPKLELVTSGRSGYMLQIGFSSERAIRKTLTEPATSAPEPN